MSKEPALQNQLSIADLYERFIETIFFNLHFEKKQEIDFKNLGVKRYSE